jgi:hypothetical protein
MNWWKEKATGASVNQLMVGSHQQSTFLTLITEKKDHLLRVLFNHPKSSAFVWDQLILSSEVPKKQAVTCDLRPATCDLRTCFVL